jgi:hypothetical protein
MLVYGAVTWQRLLYSFLFCYRCTATSPHATIYIKLECNCEMTLLGVFRKAAERATCRSCLEGPLQGAITDGVTNVYCFGRYEYRVHTLHIAIALLWLIRNVITSDYITLTYKRRTFEMVVA